MSHLMQVSDKKDTAFLKKLEKVVNRDYKRLQPEPEPCSLITTNTSMPMKLKKKITHGEKFDCPDSDCTVCTKYFQTLPTQQNEEGAPEDYVVDHI